MVGRVHLLGFPRRARPTGRVRTTAGTMLNRFARALFTRLLTPVARVLLAAADQPRRGDARRHPRRRRRGARLLSPGRELLLGHDRDHGLRLLRHRRRDHGPAVRRSGKWGAFLDSTLDRVGDAAIFGGLVLPSRAGAGDDSAMAALALACLVLGSGRLVRQGPGRGPGDDRERRASPSGPTGWSPCWSPPGSSGSGVPVLLLGWCSPCSRWPAWSPCPADADRPRPGDGRAEPRGTERAARPSSSGLRPRMARGAAAAGAGRLPAVLA